MSPLMFSLHSGTQFLLNLGTMLEPQVGDIVIRRRRADSNIRYYPYKSPEQWYQYHKTWLLKIFPSSVLSALDSDKSSNLPPNMKCMMLMVWEYGLGFKEAMTGGILIPEAEDPGAAQVLGLGRGGTVPDQNTIVLAFTQPSMPHGPTFLRADFWKEKYLHDDYANLMVFSVVDSLIGPSNMSRTVTNWSRAGLSWVSTNSITGARNIEWLHCLESNRVMLFLKDICKFLKYYQGSQ
jgi:hypothetical protein